MTDDVVDPALLALIRDGLASAVPFAQRVGIVLEEVADASAVATLGSAPELLNHVATMHAGALFTLAETASGAAMAGTFAPVLGEIRPVVSGARIDYLRPAASSLRAVATIGADGAALRRQLAEEGRVSFEVQVGVTDERGRDVATFVATWVVTHAANGRPERA